jgi:Subtilase family
MKRRGRSTCSQENSVLTRGACPGPVRCAVLITLPAFVRRFRLFVALAAAVTLAGCGGSSGGGANGSAAAQLATDRHFFEDFELHGGESSVSLGLPYGGGTLVSGVNYAFSTSSGGLKQSPLTGPQTQTAVVATLDSGVSIPSLAPTRIIQAGAVWLLPVMAERRVSYTTQGIQVDGLAADGTTVLTSALYSNFVAQPLAGMMGNSPEELLAEYPISEWIRFNNFAANALWTQGSGYIKRSGRRNGDTLFASDCGNSDTVSPAESASTNPCATNTTLDNFFPITLGVGTHPSETDFLSDGAITAQQGVRIWIAGAPLPPESSTIQSFRVYYELGGNVYMGALEKDGAAFATRQADGSAVNYQTELNAAAVQSIQKGLITGVIAPGSPVGGVAEVATIDLFGIGGHGVNGSLAPADLRAHYNVPATLTGAGQTIAIVDAPGTGDVADDLNIFSDFYQLPECNAANPCFQHIDLSDGAAIPAGSDVSSEVALDVEMAHAIAPDAKIILVTSTDITNTGLMNAVNYAAQLPGVTTVSLSYSLGGTAEVFTAEDVMLAQFQTNLGTIFLASSGDDGSALGARYPASSPFFTAVGGTRVTTVLSMPTPANEIAWEFSEGGASTYAAMPAWQSAYLPAATVTLNNSMRAVPDVAAVADYQHSAFGVYLKDQWVMSGGTSAAAPLWAGVTALLGEQLAAKGSSLAKLVAGTAGGFNGLIYQMKLTQGATVGFVDIVSGSNDLSNSPCPVCSAATGYDDVTGLGVPDVQQFLLNF